MGRLARRLSRLRYRAPCAPQDFQRTAARTWARSVRESRCVSREIWEAWGRELVDLWWMSEGALERRPFGVDWDPWTY